MTYIGLRGFSRYYQLLLLRRAPALPRAQLLRLSFTPLRHRAARGHMSRPHNKAISLKANNALPPPFSEQRPHSHYLRLSLNNAFWVLPRNLYFGYRWRRAHQFPARKARPRLVLTNTAGWWFSDWWPLRTFRALMLIRGLSLLSALRYFDMLPKVLLTQCACRLNTTAP